ncbi:protein BTG1-like [Astyanax mexicanus]|uniref:BTG anti-proliferation factor 1 n=1 Tax=Astyanax mexicanus TaxID=7994 RepID=A0A8B9JEU1_ASTMX|nr:protein BTG1-like [Astyanax mexicanus]
MKTEVSTAVNFISTLLRGTGLLSEEQLHQFSLSLEEALGEHYQHHWFPDAPCRGSGYRCIRINHKMDPLIGKAALTIGLTREQLFSLLPSELTMWVDPYEVSYRIGEDGSICVLYESAPPSQTDPSPVDTCKDKLRIGRSSPSKSFNMMTVSS